MSINLEKGQKISLVKGGQALSNVRVCLGWDMGTKKVIDCDSTVIMLSNDKLVDNGDMIYYGHKKHSSRSIIHNGDNLTGAGDGDDETIDINLNQVPEKYNKLVIVVNIFSFFGTNSKKKHFGLIENAFCRILDNTTNSEICRYNLTEDYTGCTAVIVGEIYRYNGQWKISAMGQGTTDAKIDDVAKRYK